MTLREDGVQIGPRTLERKDGPGRNTRRNKERTTKNKLPFLERISQIPLPLGGKTYRVGGAID